MAHPFMNLYEGNVYPNIELDFAPGSGGYETLYRNYVNMTSTNPDTGQPMTGALYAVALAYYKNYDNVFGNVIGAYPSGCTASSYQIMADASQGPSIFKIGYYDDGGSSSPNASLSAKVQNTLLRGGNWDCKTGSVIWNNNVPSGSLASSYIAQVTLPASLYTSVAPTWFAGSGVTWPPIEPSATTKVNKIPAQVCYESGPATGGAFTPSSCYDGTTSARPQPPTGLTATVQ